MGGTFSDMNVILKCIIFMFRCVVEILMWSKIANLT